MAEGDGLERVFGAMEENRSRGVLLRKKTNFEYRDGRVRVWQGSSHDHGMASGACFDEVVITFNTNPRKT